MKRKNPILLLGAWLGLLAAPERVAQMRSELDAWKDSVRHSYAGEDYRP